MARDVEHFFMCFSAFAFLPLKKEILLPISSLGHWVLENLVFWASYIFWLSIIVKCTVDKDFLLVCGLPINLVTISIVVQKFYTFM
jgi:hypothetical protein